MRYRIRSFTPISQWGAAPEARKAPAKKEIKEYKMPHIPDGLTTKEIVAFIERNLDAAKAELRTLTDADQRHAIKGYIAELETRAVLFRQFTGDENGYRIEYAAPVNATMKCY